MKTLIQKLNEAASILDSSFHVKSGNYEMTNNFVKLPIEMKSRHIQFLINSGAKFDLKNKRKATGMNGNEFILDVKISIESLVKIEKFNGKSADNNQLFSFMNDHSLVLAGFPYKRIALSNPAHMSRIIYPFQKAAEKLLLSERLKMFKKGSYNLEKIKTTFYFA